MKDTSVIFIWGIFVLVVGAIVTAVGLFWLPPQTQDPLLLGLLLVVALSGIGVLVAEAWINSGELAKHWPKKKQ